MVATSPEHMPETRQEVRNGREPRVPAPAWDNSPPSGRSAAVAYLLWEQVVAGSIPAAPTIISNDLHSSRRACILRRVRKRVRFFPVPVWSLGPRWHPGPGGVQRRQDALHRLLVWPCVSFGNARN